MENTNRFITLSEHLAQAENKRQGVEPLTSIDPEITVVEAYQVQLATVERKIAEGRRIVGKKIGLTSRAMQKLLGVDQPDYGHLLDDMEVADRGSISPQLVLQPKVEAEIAFVLKKDLVGPHVTVPEVLLATDYVVPALEVVDSRVSDWKIKLQDTIADNASSSRVFFGNQMKHPDKMELDLLGVTLKINGEIKDLGAGAAVLGHPANSVAMLANMLARKGQKLNKGEIILAGAITSAFMLTAGDSVVATFDGLGTVEFIVKE